MFVKQGLTVVARFLWFERGVMKELLNEVMI